MYMEYSLKSAAFIGANAMSASIIAMSANINDWKLISVLASAGCFLGARYIEYKKTF